MFVHCEKTWPYCIYLIILLCILYLYAAVGGVQQHRCCLAGASDGMLIKTMDHNVCKTKYQNCTNKYTMQCGSNNSNSKYNETKWNDKFCRVSSTQNMHSSWGFVRTFTDMAWKRVLNAIYAVHQVLVYGLIKWHKLQCRCGSSIDEFWMIYPIYCILSIINYI